MRRVVDMKGLFYGASRFNQPLDQWDVNQVNTMESTFHDAVDFNQSINSWNIGNGSPYFSRMEILLFPITPMKDIGS